MTDAPPYVPTVARAAALRGVARPAPAGRKAGALDAIVLDASLRQALVATRSLGAAGLRVGLVEACNFASPRWSTLAFASRWASSRTVAPSLEEEPDSYARAVVDLVRRNPGSVVVPCSDQSLAALRPCRTKLERAGRLAAGSESALTAAVDKVRTLDVARTVGIAVPPTVLVSAPEDVAPALAELSYPLVVKPAASWLLEIKGKRLTSVGVASRREAMAALGALIDAGIPAHVQPWLGGHREAVSLFQVGGRESAAFAQVTDRTTPVLGGASVIRRSVPLPADLHRSALSLVDALGLDGFSDVEFRRDLEGRPYLMEVNPRLAGSLELAVRCGVDFPMMAWRWAMGLPVEKIDDYRVGVQMRWLTGDLRWLKETLRGRGGPDRPDRAKAVGSFLASFAAPHLYDTFDAGDPGPMMVELGRVADKGTRQAGHRLAAFAGGMTTRRGRHDHE